MKTRDINSGQYPALSDFPVACFSSRFDDLFCATGFEVGYKCGKNNAKAIISWWGDDIEVKAKELNLWIPLSELRKMVE